MDVEVNYPSHRLKRGGCCCGGVKGIIKKSAPTRVRNGMNPRAQLRFFYDIKHDVVNDSRLDLGSLRGNKTSSNNIIDIDDHAWCASAERLSNDIGGLMGISLSFSGQRRKPSAVPARLEIVRKSCPKCRFPPLSLSSTLSVTAASPTMEYIDSAGIGR